MSGCLNKVELIGRLGQNPEARQTKDGKTYVRFTLATNERGRHPETGEPRERTEWHRIVIFNERLAEIAEAYLTKGRQVYLEGKMQTRGWTDPSGQERITTEVVLSGFNSQLVLLDGQGSATDEEAA